MFAPNLFGTSRLTAAVGTRCFRRRGGMQKGGSEVVMTWVALVSEAVVLLAAAGAAVRWVRRSAVSAPDQAGELVERPA
ncbi:hypothetical protein GCM10010470_32140 [Saccharopolyspora taberi]|uniref:Uncharacterized protein n=1 Tax=Saccharopolyspora taberi TaxID=60895 RepID=A0ABN3VDL4_9PSEU